MKYLNKIKSSMKNIKNNIKKKNNIKEILKEKIYNYNLCTEEISKLEKEVKKLSDKLKVITEDIQYTWPRFTIIPAIAGIMCTITTFAIYNSLSITSLIPATIGTGISIASNLINKKMNITDQKILKHQKIQQEIEQKELELSSKKEKANSLAEEISNLKIKLNENTNIIIRAIEELNSMLENDNKPNQVELKPKLTTKKTEYIRPKVKLLKPSKIEQTIN